jgi:CO/xanthine dehydrogenase Mo-binding subunit
VRTELGVEQVVVRQADTSIGDSGSSSASRQTWMTGGAVRGACEAVRAAVLDRAAAVLDLPAAADVTALVLRDGAVHSVRDEEVSISLVDLLGDEPIDDERGQGAAHVAFAYAAHRAVVDVDTELGLVRVVELATAQDVGKAINPVAVEGQIEGGTAQGLGLALMEEVQIVDGRIRNASFTDYLIPTILDMPPVPVKVFEFPHPDSPYGLNGVGEPPNLSSTPAIMNALRNATGLDLPRVPVRPTDLIPDIIPEETT